MNKTNLQNTMKDPIGELLIGGEAAGNFDSRVKVWSEMGVRVIVAPLHTEINRLKEQNQKLLSACVLGSQAIPHNYFDKSANLCWTTCLACVMKKAI